MPAKQLTPRQLILGPCTTFNAIYHTDHGISRISQSSLRPCRTRIAGRAISVSLALAALTAR